MLHKSSNYMILRNTSQSSQTCAHTHIKVEIGARLNLAPNEKSSTLEDWESCQMKVHKFFIPPLS